ncbi:MAG: hypothetical protein HC773_21540 [Scytonema sp. CRU_2_7]|nr:hypothetical protein [Scytonema sp. CRU_2_7]
MNAQLAANNRHSQLLKEAHFSGNSKTLSVSGLENVLLRSNNEVQQEAIALGRARGRL